YARMRTDQPTRLSPDGEIGAAAGDLLDYVRADPALTLVAYSPLLGGAYDRADRPMSPEHDHPGTVARLAALREVAAETGATAGQVVLAWRRRTSPRPSAAGPARRCCLRRSSAHRRDAGRPPSRTARRVSSRRRWRRRGRSR